MNLGKGGQITMKYTFFLANASLTLRVIEFLNFTDNLSVNSITVIHRIDGWLVNVNFSAPLSLEQDGDFRAFINELGIFYEPDILLQKVFRSLETGQSPVEVMRRYQVAIVSHGRPNLKDIEAFRQDFTEGLGYCPETLA